MAPPEAEKACDLEEATWHSDDDACCAICFEHKQFVSLPCACKVNYCASCWDRALAMSVTVRGRAQCPSCRSRFNVDFDPQAGGLVFTPGGEAIFDSNWKTRLYGKARPVQIELLRRYGAERELAERQGAAAVVPRSCGAESGGGGEACGGTKPAVSEGSTDGDDGCSQLAPVPLCVCGSQLERISARTRVERMLRDADRPAHFGAPGDPRVDDYERLVQRLMGGSLVTCDLCDDRAMQTGAVWTCKNGPHTVLHPAAYDVCECCFARHAGPPASRGSSKSSAASAAAAAAPARPRGGSDAGLQAPSSGSRSRSRGGLASCWKSCCAAVCRVALPARFHVRAAPEHS